MNKVQKAVFDHLTVPGHPQRLQCLEDLLNRGFPGTQATEVSSRAFVLAYLDKNPRGFCAEGVQRLRDVVDPQPKEKEFLRGAVPHTSSVVLNRDGYIEIYQGKNRLAFASRSPYAKAIVEAIEEGEKRGCF